METQINSSRRNFIANTVKGSIALSAGIAGIFLLQHPAAVQKKQLQMNLQPVLTKRHYPINTMHWKIL